MGGAGGDNYQRNFLKLIAKVIDRRYAARAWAAGNPYTPTLRGTWESMGRLEVGLEKVACCSTKAAISLKSVKIEEKLLWGAYRKAPALFRMVPSATPYGLPFPKRLEPSHHIHQRHRRTDSRTDRRQ